MSKVELHQMIEEHATKHGVTHVPAKKRGKVVVRDTWNLTFPETRTGQVRPAVV